VLFKIYLVEMNFTIGSSRVTLSRYRSSSSFSAQYRLAGADPEKAIQDELYESKSVISNAQDDGKPWTVREVGDMEHPDVMLLSSWKKALVPFLGVTTLLPMFFSLWYTFAQIGILRKHSEQLSKDSTILVGLSFAALELILIRRSSPCGL
jgi:hypothetical protein